MRLGRTALGSQGRAHVSSRRKTIWQSALLPANLSITAAVKLRECAHSVSGLKCHVVPWSNPTVRRRHRDKAPPVAPRTHRSGHFPTRTALPLAFVAKRIVAEVESDADSGKPSLVDLSVADAGKWTPLLQLPRGSVEPRSAPDYEGVTAIRQRQRRLTISEVQRVAQRYDAGATVYELATEFGCHRATIAERLKLAGVTMRHQVASAEQVDEFVQLYESGLSMVKVAAKVGVSASTVLNYLHRREVQMEMHTVELVSPLPPKP